MEKEILQKQLEDEIEALFERVRKNAWKVMGTARLDCEIDSDDEDVGLPKIFNGND